MTSLSLISAMVLVYCTIVSASPTSDAWFMKEMNGLMEAKEQMDELIDVEHKTETSSVEELEDDGLTATPFFSELMDSMLSPQQPEKTCTAAPGGTCNYTTLINITKIVRAFCKSVEEVLKELTEIEGTGDSCEKPATSCKSILELNPNAESGTYWVQGREGAEEVHCEMRAICGRQSGGWMRIADIDMTQTNECPSPLKQVSGRKLCGTTIGSDGGCSGPSTFETHGIQYSQVCGRIRAFQKGSTDAFASPFPSNKGVRGVSINQAYVDGISLTHGNPRTHIFTFASALNDNDTGFTFAQCPCMRTFGERAPRVPDFVGNNFVCNTANQNKNIPKGNTLFLDHDLWSVNGCSPRNQCCSVSGLPWFSRSLDSPTCDDVEMRVCNDEGTKNENVWLDQVELYVQ